MGLRRWFGALLVLLAVTAGAHTHRAGHSVGALVSDAGAAKNGADDGAAAAGEAGTSLTSVNGKSLQLRFKHKYGNRCFFLCVRVRVRVVLGLFNPFGTSNRRCPSVIGVYTVRT